MVKAVLLPSNFFQILLKAIYFMNLSVLTAISPIDGRYRKKVHKLANYFSEAGLIGYRVMVEIEYFIKLCELPLPQLVGVDKSVFPALRNIYDDFTIEEAKRVKEIEYETNHDVKAVEYFIKEQFDKLGLSDYKEFIHFGLTSQDINNTATPLLLKQAFEEEYIPLLQDLLEKLEEVEEKWRDVPMLSRTHGQPASPTLLGKEMMVFLERLVDQFELLETIPFTAKFGGAIGNFNAHYVAYPSINWIEFGTEFINSLGLDRSVYTTQIEHYDNMGALFDNLKRINTILIDLSQDIWAYVSMDYFKQRIKKGEVGSSTMPHKVNPIDFENAEGNLGIANAFLSHLANKLPISRLQRDLTDSTVSRNIGVPFAHTVIAIKSILRGFDKLVLNEAKIRQDLEKNWVVVAEAVQTVLRREGYPKPYEALKALTRTHHEITESVMHSFIDELAVTDSVKEELKRITPFNYTGKVYEEQEETVEEAVN